MVGRDQSENGACGPTSVFLTGGTGFLGQYVLAAMLERTDARCRVLVRGPLDRNRERLFALLSDLGHDAAALVAGGRLEVVEGSLPDAVDARLLDGVDTIVHAAASVCFEADDFGEPMRTNANGTEALLRSAAAADVRHVALVSTAYVCGRRSGRVAEAPIGAVRPEFANAYEASKWEAERALGAWSRSGRGRVATVIRPSILFGDRASGRVTNFNGVYLVARATEMLSRAADADPAIDRHAVPLRIIGSPDATSNLVPVDFVAGAVVDVLLDPARHGRVHHLTNPDPPTHAEIKAWLEAHFDVGGGRFCEQAWPLPDANGFESVFYSLGGVVRDYFRLHLSFESSAGTGDVAGRNGGRLITEEVFRRSLQYAQDHRWGRGVRRRANARRNNGGGNERELPDAIRLRRIDPGWYFERFLPERIPGSSVAKVHALTAVARFRIGDPVQEWTCLFQGGRLVQVRPGPNGCREQFGFRVSRDTFDPLVKGETTLQAAFFQGEADVFGDVERALHMVPVMTEFIRENPVRPN